ncbi:MAG: MerR family transcriptional regulator [Gammaproteobacteria bacterium]
MTSSQLNDSGVYPISTVSAMTGVNAITLRAWERRYGLLQPMRTEAGHRLYTSADVELIKSILRLLDEGIAISRVTDALKNISRKDDVAEKESGPWQRYQQTMLDGVATFNEAILETVYNEAMSLYPVDVVTRQLLLPLMKILGKRWQEESAGIAEEHFFSVFMRNKLGARFHHRNLQNNGPRIVAACLPGEQHEFGLLLFALSAHARGYRIILLGADMPLAQLPEVVKRSQSDAVVLSGSSGAVTGDVEEEISAVVSLSKVPVFIGGSFAQQHRQSLEEIGARPLADDLIVGLHTIGKELPVVSS